MINEVHFHSSRHLGTWLKVLLRDGSAVRVRLFATAAEVELATTYTQSGVAFTPPFATPTQATQAAMDVIYAWRLQNPYSHLGFFCGLLLLPEGSYVGTYKTATSSTEPLLPEQE